VEDGRTDALIARDRCLVAIVTCEDLETAQALWRAALRYNAHGKGVAGIDRLELVNPRPRARLHGEARDVGVGARIEG